MRVYKRNDTLPNTTIEGDTVLLDIETGKYYGLSGTAHRIWSLLQSPLSMEQICDALQKEYNVSRDQCEQDVQVFLKELAHVKLVDCMTHA